MSLSPGTRLGHYDVTALLGEGGMGQVWQATDSKLNRQVALKLLADAFAADPDRLARFQREAQVLASLNHPNIAAIYGIEEAQGTRALVLELVEGPTLADRIAQGAMPMEDALPIARQIAEALEAAHEAGVIHRDLKPANIKVREDGTVKVLDFGLAKALAGDGPDADLSQSPTVTASGTREGVILGTAAYMSPEQARGKTLDKRTDIWSFGCVLYEMLTGRAVFGGDTLSDTIANVLDRDPQWATLPGGTPPAVRKLLRRCLDKDPRERLHDVADARWEIAESLGTPDTDTSQVVGVAPPQMWQRPASFALMAAIVAIVTGLTVWVVMRPGALARPQLARFVIEGAERVYSTESSLDLAISTDGRRIAYLTGNSIAHDIRVRQLDQLVPTTLVSEGRPFNPFFSPDGQWVGFWDIVGSVLKKVPVQGGPTLEICDLPGVQMRGATWGADDTIVFGMERSGSGLWRVHAGGGEPVRLTEADEQVTHRWPAMLPGGQTVLFTIRPSDGGTSQLAVVSLDGGDPKLLNLTGSDARYLPTGHLVYGVDGTLRAARFDLARLEVTGDPTPVVDAVITKGSGSASFGVADDGTFVYIPGGSGAGAGGADGRVLVWVTPAGREERVLAEPRGYSAPRISPDGTKLVSDAFGPNDVLIFDFAEETWTRWTDDAGVDSDPIWTADGLRIVWGGPPRRGAQSVLESGGWHGTGRTPGHQPQRPASSLCVA